MSPVRVIEFLYVGLVVWRLCTLAVSVLYYGWKPKCDYWRLTDPERRGSLEQWLARADRGAIFLLSDLLAVPAVNILAEALACKEDCEIYVLGVFALPAALICILADRFFLVDIAWKVNNDGPISPQFSFFVTISELSAAIVVAVAHSNILIPILLILCGAVKIATVYRALPFHTALRNHVESGQGVGIIWEAALYLLVQGVPNASLAPAMLLLIGLPVVFAINFTMLKSRIELFIVESVDTEVQHAQALLRASKQPGKSGNTEDSLLKYPFLRSSRLQDLHLYPLLWTAYYYMSTEEYFFAKMAIGLVSKQDRNWRNTVQIETCISRLHSKLQANDEDEESLQRFLLLNPLLAKIQQYDYITSALIKDFIECIEWKSSPFHRFVKISRKAANFAEKTEKFYQRAIGNFPHKASLMQTFAGFLEMMGKLQGAEKFSNIADKLMQRNHKKAIFTANHLIEDDPFCVILVVDLTGNHKGRIKWSINGTLLGYSDEELKETSSSALLPSQFHSKFSEMLSKLATTRAIPCFFRSDATVNALLVDKTGKLLSGTGKVFCSNERITGELMGICLIRIEPASKDFSLISPDGALMECTPSFSAFKQETRFLSEYNLTNKDVIWKGKWRGDQLIVSEDSWEVCEQLKLRCISLFKMRRRQSATSDYSIISETHPAHMEKSSGLFQSHYSTVTDTDWIQHSVETSQITHNKTLYSAHAMKNELKRLNKWLILALILTCVAGSAVALAVVESFSLSTKEINQAIAGITSVGMRVLSLSAAIRSKELYLAASGFPLFGNETAAKANLNTISTDLGKMHAALYANLSTATGFYQQQLMQPITPFWRYENGHFRRYEMNLLDVMEEMARRSASLANCSLASVNSHNSDFMTLYRNGVEEALVAFNASVGAFGDWKNREREAIMAKLRLAALFGSLCCLGLFTPLLGWLLLSLERRRKQIWTQLLNLPTEIAVKALELVNTRLEMLNANGLYIQQMRANKQGCSYESSRDMKILAVGAMVGCCLISMAGLVLYLYGYSVMNAVLVYKPGYIDWMGMRRAAVMKGWFHMRESWLPSNLSYPVLIPSLQTQYRQSIHWERANELLLMLHRCYVAGCPMHNMHHLFPSNQQKDVLMGVVPNTTAVALKGGLTPLLNEIVMLSYAARADLRSDPSTNYSKGKKLEQYTNLAYSALTVSNRQFDADTIQLLDAANAELFQAATAVACISFAILALGGLPLIWKVMLIQIRGNILRETDTLTQFPV